MASSAGTPPNAAQEMLESVVIRVLGDQDQSSVKGHMGQDQSEMETVVLDKFLMEQGRRTHHRHRPLHQRLQVGSQPLPVETHGSNAEVAVEMSRRPEIRMKTKVSTHGATGS